MTLLYYDCFSGISGDMNLAALIDLGVPAEYLQTELLKLPVSGYQLQISKSSKMGIGGTLVKVYLTSQTKPTFNPASLKVGAATVVTNSKSIVNVQSEHRTFAAIRDIINASALNQNVKSISIKIFQKVAFAEGKVHGMPIDEVHFHEVGAVDSIVDIVGAAICLDYLKPDKIMASAIELGGGMVRCEHGLFPVPAPATAEILAGIPINTGGANFETTTPTGAAILAATATAYGSLQQVVITKTAYGIGHKDGERPNVLRVLWCETETKSASWTNEEVMVAECNLDDNTPETSAYVMEGLLQRGAQDVYFTPIIMKKSRPAITLSFLCLRENLDSLLQFVFTETSTLGIRWYTANKSVLARRFETIETPWGSVRIKIASLNGVDIKKKPEYDDCAAIALKNGIALTEVYTVVNQIIGRCI